MAEGTLKWTEGVGWIGVLSQELGHTMPFHTIYLQGDTSRRRKPPVDLVPTFPAAVGPLL